MKLSSEGYYGRCDVTFLVHAKQRLHPDLVINAGTAGGFGAKGAAIGDVFVSSLIHNHDRRIPIPGYEAYGIGEYHSVPTVSLRAVSR